MRFVSDIANLHCIFLVSREFHYPFEVAIEGIANVRGVILADQVKSLDWQVRKAEKKGSVAKTIQEEVADKIRAILGGVKACKGGKR